MSNYIINKNVDNKGYNEVRKLSCMHLPASCNRILLGTFSNEVQAVNYAKKIGYYNADGCYFCCPLAHRG